ncbi:threonylcarbamoyl-AMP synthase [Carnobacterium sp. PL24RED07]|uniref:L-threonylcarbamoyladenylate synthase n=1 Tax=unclassified Carnobacterium TaxID=257487 RepID=UPI0011EEE943|nr:MULTISPECIES: L-threonylcarbamoyladenylate synthase [unclassified Carnobacterium]KAF3300572.1 threonylcarbamoyl-AMP synthase [Carnobacterium sp. PL12RED10]KAF3303646.1 threonylcarbamoyl-AMP synthase [Carnobacterium sp. PL26RED25]KAF3306768.1 threonylcarbamoyl-AMP synthase [Carnobacterium sp. PL17GRE32]KAF3307164.1 threonylcarbamoyl-AMP synthase [Carnobacterium sp. PL24RED07]
MTKIIQASEIEEGAALLQDGQLVAFPTETVFGLGAIANNVDAVKSVYTVKGRPSDNPLIVHIADPEDIFDYMIDNDPERHDLIEKLTAQFWPGPLTLVVPVKPDTFPSVVTGGMDTVGIRLPDHGTTRDLIRATGFPIVGPSANISGKPSPTQVAHVMHDFDGVIGGVVNAEPTRIGVESTVLDLTDLRGLIILRPGYITKSMLAEVVTDMPIYIGGTIANNAEEAPKAPGMKYVHYSPNQPVMAVSSDKMANVLAYLSSQSIKVALATSENNFEKYKTSVASIVSLGPTIETATQQLFAALRTFDDQENIQQIVVELYPDTEKNGAYRNRLIKASSTVVE